MGEYNLDQYSGGAFSPADLINWPGMGDTTTKMNAKIASALVYALLLVIVVLVIVYFVVLKPKKEGYGGPQFSDTDSAAGFRTASESFDVSKVPDADVCGQSAATLADVPGTPTLILDSVDAKGVPCRKGKSGMNYYPVMNAQGQPMVDRCGNLVYTRMDEPRAAFSGFQTSDAADLLKTNWDNASLISFGKQCKQVNPDANDTWGWLNAQARAGGNEYTENLRSGGKKEQMGTDLTQVLFRG